MPSKQLYPPIASPTTAATTPFTPVGDIASTTTQDAVAEVDTKKLAKSQNLAGLTDKAIARANLQLGTLATQNANAATITGGSISGITDLGIADGGTGASTTATARANLGINADNTPFTPTGDIAANTTQTAIVEVAIERITKVANLSDLSDVSVARNNLGVLAATENRRKINANATYYVSPAGTDLSSGLSAATPFLTIQKAIDTAAGLDLGIYDVTIQLSDGTYSLTDAIVCKTFAGAGRIIIRGNPATPANVLITTSENLSVTGAATGIISAVAISGIYKIVGLKLQKTGTGTVFGIFTNFCYLEYETIDFGTGVTQHIRAEDGGTIKCTGNYTISGGAAYHFVATGNAVIRCQNRTITLINVPDFPTGFALSSLNACQFLTGNTYTGTATGKQYGADRGGIIAAQPATLPGNVAGTATNGGQYF